MKKQLFLTAAALLLCVLADVPLAGLCFFAGAWLVSFPRLPGRPWYEIVIGGLISSIGAMLAGGGSLLFWGLLIAASLALALNSLPKTALLCAAAWAMLRFDAAAEIYIALFAGAGWNSIFLFTSGKICDKIEVS